MSYQLKSKPRKNVAFGRAWKITLVFCFFIFLISRISPTLFYRVTEPIARPLWSIREGLKNRFSFIISKKVLIDENKILREELSEANLALVSMQSLIAENNLLKALKGDSSLIPAKVISRPNISFYDNLIVDFGERKVMVGAKVYSKEKIILGTVAEVYGKTAKVTLFSNNGFETNVEILESGTPLTLIGQGGGNFRAFVPKDFPIEIRNITLVPAFVSHVIAEVLSIDETEADSYKTLYLSYPINIFEIGWVGIENG